MKTLYLSVLTLAIVLVTTPSSAQPSLSSILNRFTACPCQCRSNGNFLTRRECANPFLRHCSILSCGTRTSWCCEKVLALDVSNSLDELAYRARIVCVKWFSMKGFPCARAIVRVRGRNLVLTIIVPTTCRPLPTRRTFLGAYNSLKNTPGFSNVFTDEPNLVLNVPGVSVLTLPFTGSAGIGGNGGAAASRVAI